MARRRPSLAVGCVSTYGTALVVDVPPGTEFHVSDEVHASFEVGFRIAAPDGWHRSVALLSAVDLVEDILDALRAAGRGRVAIAEDNDEFGARWVVAHAANNAAQVVHRRYILNADPDDVDEVDVAVGDLGGDPRELDVAGPGAAAAAAMLFGVPTDPMITAERESAAAWREIGIVGGPFPWWSALVLPWPVPPTGQPLDW